MNKKQIKNSITKLDSIINKAHEAAGHLSDIKYIMTSKRKYRSKDDIKYINESISDSLSEYYYLIEEINKTLKGI